MFEKELHLLDWRIRYLSALRHEIFRMFKGFDLVRRDARELHHFGIDPGFFVNRAAVAGTEFEHDTFGSAHINRLAETVIDGSQYPMTRRAHPIANRQQIGFGIDVERDVLHRTRLLHRGLCGLCGAAERGRTLHESERAGVAEAQEAVESFARPMHPVERAQLSAHDLGEKLDLGLDVLGIDREMIKSVGYTHG